MSQICPVTEADYESRVLHSSKPVVVKFGSKTCGPCLLLGAALKDIAPEYSDDEVQFFDVDVEEAPAIAKQYGIMAIPVLLFIQNGEVKQRFMGNQSRNRLSTLVEAHIGGQH